MPKETENQQSVSDRVIAEFNQIIKKFPDSSEFLGKDLIYPEPKKRWFGTRKKLDVTEIRDEVQKFTEKEGVTRAREMINKKMKQYPYSADLNALRAIQLYNDLSRSGLNQNKMDALYDPLVMIGKALHNGGTSIYNANWFMTIYLKYLEIIKERLAREYRYGLHHADPDVRSASERLYQKILKIPRMMQVKGQLAGLTNLNVKLKGTSIITENISIMDLKLACQAVAGKNPTKTIGAGKPANSVVYVTLILNSLFARIPILKESVANILKHIPDLNRDLILQKQMIISSSRTNDFLLAVAAGNKEQAKSIASKLYLQCIQNITYYLENALLKQQYEADPFIKAAWIAKEARPFFDADTNRERLRKGTECLDVILGSRCQHKGSLERATKYQAEVRAILADQDWMKE
ncbi:hypothetical protein KKI24_29740 [bacterium]|nr:hypothetical protein [bacterium]